MTARFETQGIQDLLSFPFRSPGGKMKLFIAAVLGLGSLIVPIVPGILVMGYGGLIMRRIIREKGEPYLPDWDNWGDMFMRGLKLSAASVVYALPFILLVMLGYAVMVVPMALEIFSSATTSQSDMGPLVMTQMLGTFGGMAIMGLGLLFSAALFVVLPPVMGHVVATDSFQAAFRVREWGNILRANFGGFMVALVLIGGVYAGVLLIAQALYMTIVLCILIPFVMALISGYLLFVANAVIAQAYVEGVEKVELQAPPAALPPELPAVA